MNLSEVPGMTDSDDVVDSMFNDMETLAAYIRTLTEVDDRPEDVDLVMQRVERVNMEGEPVHVVWGGV